MTWQDWLLVSAGSIGCAVAVIHGVLTEKRLVRSATGSADRRLGPLTSTGKLVHVLLQFSTFTWLSGGCLLIFAAFQLERDARLVAILFVGLGYIYGAIGNFWATNGRHPGWVLLTLAAALLAVAAIS